MVPVYWGRGREKRIYSSPNSTLRIIPSASLSDFPPLRRIHYTNFKMGNWLQELGALQAVDISFFFFNWRLITILLWFLPYIDMNQPQMYMSPHPTAPPCHPEPSSHLPPHPIPLGCPSASVLSALFHASNLDWSSLSHMVIYMFQCHSLKSSHPLLPQRRRRIFLLKNYLMDMFIYLTLPGWNGSCPLNFSLKIHKYVWQ